MIKKEFTQNRNREIIYTYSNGKQFPQIKEVTYMMYHSMNYMSFVATPNSITRHDPSIVRYAEFFARDRRDSRIIHEFILRQDKTGYVEAARYSKIENGSYIRTTPQMFYCHDFFGCLADFRKKTDPL